MGNRRNAYKIYCEKLRIKIDKSVCAMCYVLCIEEIMRLNRLFTACYHLQCMNNEHRNMFDNSGNRFQRMRVCCVCCVRATE